MDKLVKEKDDIITNSWIEFLDSVKKLEKEVYDEIIKFIKSYIEKPKGNKLSIINRILSKLINPKIFKSSVSAYMKNFDQVEEITKKIHSQVNDLDLKDFNLTIEKQLAIDDIVKGLLTKEMLDANLHSPLRKILYRYATTNISILDAENELRKFILNEDNKSGFAERYVKNLASESLSRFDGMINQRIEVEFGLDCFRIVGGLISTSSEQCILMVDEKGDLGKFAVNGKYANEDKPEIIRILKEKYKGVNKDLNVNNYYILKNHYGCLHQFLPSKLLKADKEILKQRKGTIE